MTTELNDKEFIFDPDRWPRWPLCPLRKHVGNFDDDDYSGRLSDALKEFRYVDYPNVDSMLQIWKVD